MIYLAFLLSRLFRNRDDTALSIRLGIRFAHDAAQRAGDVVDEHLIVDHHFILQQLAVHEHIEAVTAAALDNFNAMREVEGNKLRSDILDKLSNIEALAAKVEERSPQTVAEYREKLTARMQEVLQSTTIDESRILTEAAIFADKVAVDEETVRLRSHFKAFDEMLLSEEPIGRKLDFLIQEMNRETNTIGSKANDMRIAKIVIEMKNEIEKIREQIQNIE